MLLILLLSSDHNITFKITWVVKKYTIQSLVPHIRGHEYKTSLWGHVEFHQICPDMILPVQNEMKPTQILTNSCRLWKV